jgi:citrate lyase subunit beta/citryl-CoA lyase
MAGIAWNAEGLGEALTVTRDHEPRGSWTEPFRFVRAQTLLTAHACGVMAIEAMHGDTEDAKGLKAAAKAARADGFSGMLAGHPSQIAEINAAFTPSEAELAAAREIVSSFEGGQSGDVTPIDRRRVDQPQLKFAKQILGSGDSRGSEAGLMRVLRPA